MVTDDQLPAATRGLLTAAALGVAAVLLIVAGLVVAGTAVDRAIR